LDDEELVFQHSIEVTKRGDQTTRRNQDSHHQSTGERQIDHKDEGDLFDSELTADLGEEELRAALDLDAHALDQLNMLTPSPSLPNPLPSQLNYTIARRKGEQEQKTGRKAEESEEKYADQTTTSLQEKEEEKKLELE